MGVCGQAETPGGQVRSLSPGRASSPNPRALPQGEDNTDRATGNGDASDGLPSCSRPDGALCPRLLQPTGSVQACPMPLLGTARGCHRGALGTHIHTTQTCRVSRSPSLSRLLAQNTAERKYRDTQLYQKVTVGSSFISCTSVGAEPKVTVPVGAKASWFYRCSSSGCDFMTEGVRDLPGVSSKDVEPIHEGSARVT